jgi:hypothetical protein
MSTRLKAVVAVGGTAAALAWINIKRQRRSAVISDASAVHIDDDSAAEIIRRVRPALERALAVS